MKRLAIFGSTGSIGTQALDIVRREQERFEVSVLVAGRNTALMEHQIREFGPKIAVMGTEEAADDLRLRVADLPVRVESGMKAMCEAAGEDCVDQVLMALVGMMGIRPTIAALKARKELALANKETLVCAGHIIMPLAEAQGIRILPVDSEHSAIFQCIVENDTRQIEKILLTASGGAFYGMDERQLSKVSLDDALTNPNWSMGRKVTIDSASLVNKGLEVIEARWLFDVPVDKIEVLVQRDSLVHSMVQFVDGGVIAQIGTPDMHVPIGYALDYPRHVPLETKRLDFAELAGISFGRPDTKTFRGLEYGYEAGRVGGSLPVVFNAANEQAVKLLLEGRIKFTDIYEIIEKAMDEHTLIREPSLEEILACEREVKALIKERWA